MNTRCLVLRRESDLEILLSKMRKSIERINRDLDAYFAPSQLEEQDAARTFSWVDYRYKDGREIRLTDDIEFPAQYLSITMPTGVMLDAICKVIFEAFDVLDCETLKLEAERDIDKNSGALARLGLGCTNDHDERIPHIISDGFRSKDVEKRRDALAAAYLLNRREFLPVLREAFVSETDDEIRRGLEFAIEILG